MNSTFRDIAIAVLGGLIVIAIADFVTSARELEKAAREEAEGRSKIPVHESVSRLVPDADKPAEVEPQRSDMGVIGQAVPNLHRVDFDE